MKSLISCAGASLLIVTASLSLLPAFESGSTNFRVKRSAVNQGGAPKASSSYGANGSAGELTSGTLNGSTKKVSDGLMKIYFYPGRIGDLAPTPGVSAGSIRLDWTAPGADGSLRQASKYVVKYSTFPAAITDQAYFENTATLFVVSVPNGPGSAENLTITGLTPGTSYYVAIEARDADENQAELSNSTYSWAQTSVLSVDISSDSYGFGHVDASSSVVSTSTIRVTNNGTSPATWSLRASTITAGSPWQLTTSSDLSAGDLLHLAAAFHLVKPSTAAFGAEDRLVPTDQASDGTKFTIDGSSTGVSVPAGNFRNVWFLVDSPLSTSTTDQQVIQVTVTAAP